MSGAGTPARCLMVQGTSSHVGKSVLVAALCRILRDEGVRAAPFKAWNMSLNSGVAANGGEMGRAQVLQAQAAGVEPHTDMNPVLLKPTSGRGTQVILEGRALGHVEEGEYRHMTEELFRAASRALERLRRDFEVVIMEGAGSPAEINLAGRDIANMRVALAAGAPVVLVGDIDRGGVFASLVGTLELLPWRERSAVAGLVINRFRGDLGLLEGGLRLLERRTKKPVLGVIPYLHDLGLDEEDGVSLEEARGAARPAERGEELDIAVVRLPHISNATDLEPLEREEGVRLRYVSSPSRMGIPDAVILPGSKSTVSDLAWMRERGLADRVTRLAELGIPVVGICGGYQMLGESIADPEGVESSPGTAAGLGLLPLVTVLAGEKSVHRVMARAVREIPVLGLGPGSPPLSGYEIHMGRSFFAGDPPLRVVERDGAATEVDDGAMHAVLPVFGCYLHGLFENRCVLEGFLSALWSGRGRLPATASCGEGRDWSLVREERIDRLADAVRGALRMGDIFRLLGMAGF